MKRTVLIILGITLVLSGLGYWLTKNKLNGVSKAIEGEEKVQIEVWIDEMASLDPNLFKPGDKVDFLVRNRPHGELTITAAQCFPLDLQTYYSKRIPATSKENEAQNQAPLLWNCRLSLLEDKALSTSKGYIARGNQLKIASKIALEGKMMRVDGYIVGLQALALK